MHTSMWQRLQLSKCTNHDDHTRPVAIACSPEQAPKVPETLVGTIEADLFFDFLHLELDDGGVDVIGCGVQLGQDRPCFFFASTGVEPTRRLWAEENAKDIDTRGNGLRRASLGCVKGKGDVYTPEYTWGDARRAR